MAFINHGENDLDFYRQLPLFNQLNIYQPYYESCAYGYVMEFFVPENNTDELVQHLKRRKDLETGICKECMMLQA